MEGAVFVLLMICSCAAVSVDGNQSSQRPNILFMMADQMRADLLGCAGNKIAKTPNLDKLASQGVRYTNAFSSTPTCTPARAAILTGLSPWYHGMLGYGTVASRYSFEMPRALADAGYHTCSIGKDHFGWNSTDNHGIDHGYHQTSLYDGLPGELDDYDEWFAQEYPDVDPMATGLEYNDYRGVAYGLPEYLHPTAWVGREATEFIETYNSSDPFFLKVSFHRPHSPYDPPKRWMEQFNETDMPPPFVSDTWDKEYAVHYDDPPPPMWCGDIGESVRCSRQAYYASVGFVDEWVGEILEMLDKKELRNNTFIFFTADHGDMMGDHYLWRKGYPYFGSAHIPMMLSWPPSMEDKVNTKRGTTLDVVTELRDILPTFLDVASADIPQSLNGSSLLHTLQKSPAVQWREYLDLEHAVVYNVTIHWNALTDGKVKYIFRAYYPDEQLFDLTQDHMELKNLASDPDWKSTLLEWRSRMVQQFEREGRGDDWVENGQLMQRQKTQVYSPHYPGRHSLPLDYQHYEPEENSDT